MACYSMKANKTFCPEIQEIENVYSFISRFFSDCEIDISIENLFKMAVDEILSNIVYYGFEESQEGAIVVVSIQIDSNAVSITFRDNGKPFDPLSIEEPDISLGIDERQMGGLGIHIIKNSFNEVHYSFENGYNVLTLKKRIV